MGIPMQNMHLNRFLIISPSHCGMRLLRRTLDRHANCAIYDTDELMESLCDAVTQESDSGVDTLGYAVNTSLHGFNRQFPFWKALLADKQLKIILLHRQNLLERYLLSISPSRNRDLEKAEALTYDRLEKEFVDRTKEFENLCQYFEGHSRLQISYECLTQDWKHQVRYLQNFVGLKSLDFAPEPQKSTIDTPILLVKQAHYLTERFKHSPWANFFSSIGESAVRLENPIVKQLENDTVFYPEDGPDNLNRWDEKGLVLNAIHPSNTIKTGRFLDWKGRISVIGRDNLIDIGDHFSAPENFFIRIVGDNNRIVFGDHIRMSGMCKVEVLGSLNVVNVEDLCDGSFKFNIDGECNEISLGKHATAQGCGFYSSESTKIQVGDDCMFSIGVHILSSDMHPVFDLDTKKRINHAKDIHIGNHVWLGQGVKVLKGANIGSGSVIGSTSIVTGTVPENSSAAGRPAEVVRKNITWTREIYDKLPREHWS